MTAPSLPQWQVVLRWEDGVRSTVSYTGSLWIGPMNQGVHQLALACYDGPLSRIFPNRYRT